MYKIALILFSFFLITLNSVNAEVLFNQKENYSTKVGDVLIFKVKTENGQDINKVITNNINYNPEFLKYDKILLNNNYINNVYKILDENNGLLKFTIKNNEENLNNDYITYYFKALKEGNTKIYINGNADENLNNIFIDKVINVNISESNNDLINNDIIINSENIIVNNKDYNISIFNNFEENYEKGKITLKVFDDKYNQVYEDSLTFVANVDNLFDFSIKAFTLSEGYYYIRAEIEYDDNQVLKVGEKEVKVLSGGLKQEDLYKNIFYAIFSAIIFVAIIRHLVWDRVKKRKYIR